MLDAGEYCVLKRAVVSREITAGNRTEAGGKYHRVRREGARRLREYLEDPERREHVISVLKSECEVKAERPA